MPMRRRSGARLEVEMRLTSWPKSWIWPRVGWIDMKSRRSSDDLPAPEGPVRKWKEPGRRWKLTSDRTSGPRSYFKARLVNRIKVVRQGLKP